jgi:HSP20 family molecular chaperone IbpA
MRFALGQEVDDGAAEAKYADGVLYLMLRKRIATPGKRISIN